MGKKKTNPNKNNLLMSPTAVLTCRYLLKTNTILSIALLTHFTGRSAVAVRQELVFKKKEEIKALV